jgi:ribosomal protein S18 acetylase RimI-like enzyme
MATFFVSLSTREMARQIALLVNMHNRLYKKHTENTILKDNADYFVEVIQSNVIGCAGLVKKDTDLCEIKHVCVHPEFRKRGIGKKLVTLAIANCPTNLIYMTIREDNVASLAMAKSLGFVQVRKHWNVDHFVITVGRRKNHDVCRGEQC